MNVIPQIFYDLIARIIPAICILAFACLTIILFNKELESSVISFLGSKDFNISNYLNLWSTLGIVVFSYLVSLILKIPSEWLSERKFFRTIFFIKQETIDSERYFLEKEVIKTKFKDIPEPWKLLSIVRVKLPSEGYRLLKMLAEIRLCEMVFLGLITFSLINFPLLFFSKNNIPIRIFMIIFFIFSSRSILQLKYSIKNSFNKGVLMTWQQIEEEKIATNKM